MINIMFMSLMIMIIPTILIFINTILSKDSISREKKSPFECGFDPMSISRTPMSTQFFLIGLVFLVFDVEITLLLPLIFMFKQLKLSMILSSSLFIIMLIYGLIMEYLEQMIEWKI
nr:TPA_asm: NADH dehydrogenase subunit 3 [Pseudomyrmex dendroicus]